MFIQLADAFNNSLEFVLYLTLFVGNESGQRQKVKTGNAQDETEEGAITDCILHEDILTGGGEITRREYRVNVGN